MTTKTGQRIASAFRDGRARTIKSTCAVVNAREDGGPPYRIYASPTVYLHGHEIAWTDKDGVVWMTLAGYPTRTTRDRLNAILACFGSSNRFWQNNWRQYYGYVSSRGDFTVEVGAHEWVPLAGPLGMLALQAARRQEDRALQDAYAAHLERQVSTLQDA